ncbi:DUF4232 domain-containing protein [Amycolatopsis palatopharyngis]|uniref:DUF4232 domain-containing protein n=1 Tax=Amycolatopsis palatopharyngis TaxID=187982 RepID=UPI000E23825E|nr:DUF4232 domain-containing protein [Amycolatopsis palatopharyngis]
MGDGKRVAVAALVLLSVGACGQGDTALTRSTTTSGTTFTPAPTVWRPSEPANPEPKACPDSGVRHEAGQVEAALGHRAVVLTLVNCGSVPRVVTGYPAVAVLDPAGVPVDVEVRHDSSYMAIDPGPKTIELDPGDSLLSVVAWSATVTDGESETGAALAVSSLPGQKPQTLEVETDLGTTGEIEVTAWDVALAR